MNAAVSPELAALVERGGPRRVEHVAAFHARMRAEGATPALVFAQLLEASVLEGGVAARRAELLLLARAARDGAKPSVAAILALKERFGTLTAEPASAPPPPPKPESRPVPRRSPPPPVPAPAPARGARAFAPLSACASLASRLLAPVRLLVRLLAAPLRHPRAAVALAVSALALHAWLFPEGWLGRGRFGPVPDGEAAEVCAAFARAGWAVAAGGEGCPLLFAHRRWVDGFPGVADAFGRRYVALCARGSAETEVVAASLLRRDGLATLRGEPVPVSETPEASERHLCALGDALAFATDLGDGLHAVTVVAGDRSERRQFLLRRPADLVSLVPAALGPGLLEATVREKGRAARLLLNPATGAAESGGYPVEFVPPGVGEEPFLPRLVDRVRSLPFVGNEPVAALEDLYYGAKDAAMRRLHGGANVEADPEVAEEPGEGEAAASPTPPPDAPVPPPAPVPSPASVPPSASAPPDAPPSLVRGLARAASGVAPALAELAGSAARGVSRTRAALFAGPTEGPAPAWDGPRVPAAIPPALAKPARRGEGVWSDEGLPQPGDGPALFTTTWRPDPARPFAVMHFASLDLSRVSLHLVAGTEEPVSPKGVRGRGRVPETAEERRALVALFNGGFRTKHGKFGFIADGLPFVAPSAGLATVAVDRDGRLRMGTYGRSLDPTRAYLHLRQNLPPLVEAGRPNTRQKYWGAALNNSTHVWRSALGVTADGRRLVYGAGNALSHATLARGMIAAGCAYAMQLDINDYHTYFHLLAPKEGRGGAVDLAARKLADDMHSEPRRGISPYTRDFFYVTWKADPPHLADERPAQGGAEQAVPAGSRL